MYFHFLCIIFIRILLHSSTYRPTFTSTASSNSVLSKPHDDYPQSSNHPPDLDEIYAALLFNQANSDVLDTDDEFVLDDNGGTTLCQDVIC